MPDYLYCTSNRRSPGLIQIQRSHDDPRLETHDLAKRLRGGEPADIQWVLRVVDCGVAERALRGALKRHADPRHPGNYRCDPMAARGEAIKFTTLRADPKKKSASRALLARVFPELRFRRRSA